MKKWQRYWLYCIIPFAIFHFIRDILQDFGIKNVLSITLTKSYPPAIARIYWMIFNTYIAEIAVFFLGIYSIKRKTFGRIGYITIVIFLMMAIAWFYYWFII